LSVASLSNLLSPLATTTNPFQNDIVQEKKKIPHVADTRVPKEALAFHGLAERLSYAGSGSIWSRCSTLENLNLFFDVSIIQ